MTDPVVHVAAFEDLGAGTAYDLWRLRQDVFVVEQVCAYPDLDGRDREPGTRHVWVEVDGVPVGYLRLLADPDTARIGRVLVARANRGQGLAEVLVRAAHDLVGDGPSVLDAQSHLEGWYARFGYVATGPEFLDDGIPHVPMRRAGEQKA